MDLSNNSIIHTKDNGIEYLQFKRLLKYKDKIRHCYTLKCSDYKEDDGNNYRNLYKSLGLDYNKLIKIKEQTHSNYIKTAHSKDDTFTNIDGLLTNVHSLSLSLRFADCTPIYLYDTRNNIIGNIHSGWKGTVKKISTVGVKKMISEYNSNPENIIACIGPSIGKCHFEVDEDVKNIFEDTFNYMNLTNHIIKKGKIKNGKQKYFIDTNLINRILLQDVGLLPENIIESNICTVCNSNMIHSYRADKDCSGRNTAIIGLL